jgi:PPOX class probable F420-dependent enzyme
MAATLSGAVPGITSRDPGITNNMSVQLPDLAKKLLDGPTFVTLTTLRKDGSAHSTTMWAKRDEDAIVFSTVESRQKAKHIARDPRVTVSLFDADNPYNYVTIEGVASTTREGGPELIQELSRKYTGEPYTNDAGTDNVRVVVTITPTRSYPHR